MPARLLRIRVVAFDECRRCFPASAVVWSAEAMPVGAPIHAGGPLIIRMKPKWQKILTKQTFMAEGIDNSQPIV